MRQKYKIWKKNDRKNKTFFAWLPTTVWFNDHVETRWLERVTVKQRYSDFEWGDEWINEEFIDN